MGCQGRISDGAVFKSTGFAKALNKSVLNLSSVKQLPGREKNVPYVLVAEDAFPLTTNIMKPYARHQDLGSRQHFCNYHLSKDRSEVENVFRILASVFRVLRKPMLLEPSKAEKIVLACVLGNQFSHYYRLKMKQEIHHMMPKK